MFFSFLINSSLSGIDVYVGDDKKLHFVDSAGADSVLPFSNKAELQVKNLGVIAFDDSITKIFTAEEDCNIWFAIRAEGANHDTANSGYGGLSVYAYNGAKELLGQYGTVGAGGFVYHMPKGAYINMSGTSTRHLFTYDCKLVYLLF